MIGLMSWVGIGLFLFVALFSYFKAMGRGK